MRACIGLSIEGRNGTAQDVWDRQYALQDDDHTVVMKAGCMNKVNVRSSSLLVPQCAKSLTIMTPLRAPELIQDTAVTIPRSIDYHKHAV